MSRRFRFANEGIAKMNYCDPQEEYYAEGWPNSPYSLYFRRVNGTTGAIGVSPARFREWLRRGWVAFTD